jgi:CPA2 family monovalent cation:H+ antiporter-2
MLVATLTHDISFLHDLAIVMIVAGLVTILFHRLKQPVVLGYILAGVIIGPHTPPSPLIVDEPTIQTLSELGIIFLMFSLGLEFSLRNLKDVGPTAFIAATTIILVMLWAGYSVGQAFGWSAMDSIFLGALISISSTTIIVKTLDELGLKKERFAQLIFGILIVEDILAIVMIALLSGFAGSGAFTATQVGTTILKLGAFLGLTLTIGLIAVPRLLNYIAGFKSNEMLLISVLSLCFGVSLLAVKLEYSVALGAFLIGTIVAEARQIGRIEMLVEPVRDMFSAVFFVSIGLLIDPALLMKYAGPVLIITGIVIFGQVAAGTFGAFLAGHDRRVALRVGMGLAQIGEFSFIIASLGLSLKVTSNFLYPIAVAVSALTTFSTPYLLRSSDGVVDWFDRHVPERTKAWLDIYTQWVSGLGSNRNLATTLVRKWFWQLAFNLILVIGIFVGIASLRGLLLRWWPAIPYGDDGARAALLLAAMLLSLPSLIAIVRKLRALSMLLSEMSVKRSAAGPSTPALRAVIASTIFAAGCLLLTFVLLLVSSAILPSWKLFFVPALIVIASAILLRRTFIRLYSKAEFALKETLSQPSPRHEVPPPALPSILRDAKLETVTISQEDPAARKLIRELALRTQSGASIVGIERDGSNIINPGADEELLPGDQVLLLGDLENLESARRVLTAKAERVQS